MHSQIPTLLCFPPERAHHPSPSPVWQQQFPSLLIFPPVPQGPPLLAVSSLNVASTSLTSIKPWHSPEDNSFSAHFSHMIQTRKSPENLSSFPLLLLHHFFPSHTKVSLLEFMASSYFNFSILCGPDIIHVPDFQSLVPGSISFLPHVPSSSWMTSMFLRKICHNCLQLLPQLLLPQLHIRLFHNTEVCDFKPPYSFLRTSIFASSTCSRSQTSPPAFLYRMAITPTRLHPLPFQTPNTSLHHLSYSQNFLGHSSFSYTCMANLQTRGRTLTTQLLYSFTVSIEFN